MRGIYANAEMDKKGVAVGLRDAYVCMLCSALMNMEYCI